MNTSTSFVRPMAEKDLSTVLSWRNHPEVRRFMYTQHEITLQEHTQWFECCQPDPLRQLLVFEHQDVPAGFIHFTQQSHQQIADWGFYLAPDAAKGTGSLLGFHALNYAFCELRLHKVCGQAIGYNDKSIRFHLKMGFQQEGTLRDQYYDGQNFHSIACFGLLAQEWHTHSQEMTQIAKR